MTDNAIHVRTRNVAAAPALSPGADARRIGSRGWTVFTPEGVGEGEEGEREALLSTVRAVGEVYGKSLFRGEASLDRISFDALDDAHRIFAKCIVKAVVASQPEFQYNGFNPVILRNAAQILGRTFYAGSPHLRLHLPSDASEESNFHTDWRASTGKTLTCWMPLLTPETSQRLQYLPRTHFISPSGRGTGRILRLVNRLRRRFRWFSREVPIEHHQALLFSARLWHRGDMNRRVTSFVSRVIRLSQFPFAEQGYARVSVSAEGAVSVDRHEGYLTLPKGQNVEAVRMIAAEIRQARDNGLMGDAPLDVFATLAEALDSQRGGTMDAVTSLAFSEVSLYFNSSAAFKHHALRAALLALRYDPGAAGSLAMLLSLMRSRTAADNTRLFDLLMAKLRTANCFSVAADAFHFVSREMEETLRDQANRLDPDYPSAARVAAR